MDKSTAAPLTSGQDKLYDILVLHLAGGRDMFITVEGTYIRWGDDDGTITTFMTMLSLVQVLFRLQHPVAGAADRPRGGAQPRPARHAREGRGGQTVSADL